MARLLQTSSKRNDIASHWWVTSSPVAQVHNEKEKKNLMRTITQVARKSSQRSVPKQYLPAPGSWQWQPTTVVTHKWRSWGSGAGNISNFQSKLRSKFEGVVWPWLVACTGYLGAQPAKSLFDQVSSSPAGWMEPKWKYCHRRQGIEAVVFFEFCCQLEGLRLRIVASTLDSSNAAVCDKPCTKNILRGREEMRTRIWSFSSRSGKALASTPLLLLSRLFHLALGGVNDPRAAQVVSKLFSTEREAHF